ncbi:MAG: glycosyltransferase family 2 protein, partial [Caldilineaceae bacterium]|nr:glycosyltransferase family 2 protein [Caldilineaceae bacterium]
MQNSKLQNIDIVIPTRNRGALIEAALVSVRNSTYAAFTLWIVDQSDDDATEQTVRAQMAEDPRIRYLRSKSRGANFARNEGVAQGNAALIAFIDDDCRVDAAWLAQLVAELQQPGVWAVFGRVLPDDATAMAPVAGEQRVSRAIPMALKDAPERRIYERNRFDLSFGHGANMGWQRAAFRHVGGFDGLIGAGGPLGTW